ALMTLLNARLGWWVRNPNPDRAEGRHRALSWLGNKLGLGVKWLDDEPDPYSSLFAELFGSVNEQSSFVHLSDGGHFENLGVYELIRRRCRYIVVIDAGTDRNAASDNMAAMLRLIRTDFGVRIELDPAQMQAEVESKRSSWHCCVGRIRYDEVDQQAVAGLMV